MEKEKVKTPEASIAIQIIKLPSIASKVKDMESNTKKILERFDMNKALHNDFDEMNEERFNLLITVKDYAKQYKKANEDIRKTFTSEFDRAKKGLIDANEKPLQELAEYCEKKTNDFLSKKAIEEKERVDKERKKIAKEALISSEVLRLSASLREKCVSIVSAYSAKLEKEFKEYTPEKKASTKNALNNPKETHLKSSKAYDSVVSAFLFNPSVKSETVKRLEDEFPFSEFYNYYFEYSEPKYKQLAKMLDKGVPTDAILEIGEKEKLEIKEKLEEDNRRVKINEALDSEIQEASKSVVKNTKKSRVFTGTANIDAYMNAVSYFVANGGNVEKLDFAIIFALKNGVELNGAEYKDVIKANKNATL